MSATLKAYLKDLRKIPLLTPQEEYQYATRVRRGDKKAREVMIRSNLRLVVNIAKHYMYFGTPLMDLIEEGNIGLMRAVEKFKPKKGFRFSTYAAWWIRQGITRCISQKGKTIRIPAYMNDLILKWKRTSGELAQQLKRAPSVEDVAKKMRLSKEKARQINYWINRITSLETPVGEDENTEMIEMVEDERAVSAKEELSEVLRQEKLIEVLNEINDREKQILKLRFGLQGSKVHTLAAVAKKFRVSRERVRQIEERALSKLKKILQNQGQRPDDLIEP